MVRKILGAKSNSLREKSKPVTKIDKKVLDIINDLKDTLAVQKDPEGVGLAAPQIGKNLRVFVVDYEGIKRVVINPKVINTKNKEQSLKKNIPFEGCLSVPYFYGPLKRPQYIKIEYINKDGVSTLEEFRGFYAQIIQHEIDHLNGILFVDKLLRKGLPLYKQGVDGEWEEVEL